MQQDPCTCHKVGEVTVQCGSCWKYHVEAFEALLARINEDILNICDEEISIRISPVHGAHRMAYIKDGKGLLTVIDQCFEYDIGPAMFNVMLIINEGLSTLHSMMKGESKP